MRNTAIVAICMLLAVCPSAAQRGAGDWMTGAYDPQRSSWVRSDGKISRQTVQKPGLALVWKLRFENPARQLNMLTPPALLEFYIGYRGFRGLGFFGGSSDRVIAVDIDLGRIEWTKDFSDGSTAAGTLPCPGGMTSALTRPTVTAYPTTFAARGAGRGTPAKSGVGAPDEGAVTIRPTPTPRPVVRRPPPSAAAAADPFSPRVLHVLALTGDGKLHSLWVSNGNEPTPAVQFLPPGANAVGLIAYDNAAYVATTNGCGGVDNGVWALDLGTNTVTHWKTAAVAGTMGPAVRPDGSLLVTGGREITALAPRTVQPIVAYTADAEFTSSPLIFEYKGKDLAAATTNDGRLLLLSADLKGPALDRTEPFTTPEFDVGALTSWQDPAGTRWILVPSAGAIVAWRIAEKDGQPKLERGWTSRDMVAPLPPVVVNGVVFALSSGEYRSPDPKLGTQERARRSKNAVLYALDPFTGKELWNSGNTMTSFVHSGGLAAGGGRIYVSTYDGTQYAFGFPMEH